MPTSTHGKAKAKQRCHRRLKKECCFSKMLSWSSCTNCSLKKTAAFHMCFNKRTRRHRREGSRQHIKAQPLNSCLPFPNLSFSYEISCWSLSPDRGIAIVESANLANWSSSGSHLLLASRTDLPLLIKEFLEEYGTKMAILSALLFGIRK